MSQEEPRRHESIVVLGQGKHDWEEATSAISEHVPGVSLTRVHSPDELQLHLRRSESEIVVIDSEWSLDRYRELVYQLKHSDSQPSLIVVDGKNDSRMIAELYNHGCQRYILREGGWVDELVIAVRHLLRYRQVVHENERIRTKLTEANMLLEERNKRLDEFSATLAHDIRGPLGGISMKLQYLLDFHQHGIDERATMLLDRALGSCQRLTGLVQSMYEFAKLGAQATKMGEIDLVDLVEQVISDLDFEESLDIEISIGTLPVVWGSQGLLRRAFHNLLSNAIKYNDKDRKLVSVTCSEMEERSLGHFAKVVVEDNGPGIPEYARKSVFSMFDRGSGPKQEGSGVGLAVVQRVAELHFGEVSLESEMGEGSRFTLLLPLEPIHVDQ